MTQKPNYSIIIIVKEIKKKGCDKVILYLHSIYNGGYAIDEKISEEDKEVLGDFAQVAELPKNATYLEAVEIAKQYGARKLVLDI